MNPTFENSMSSCALCPRACGVNRTAGQVGTCGMTHELRVARIAPHMWEEPPISGERGSGTVFFTDSTHARVLSSPESEEISFSTLATYAASSA